MKDLLSIYCLTADDIERFDVTYEGSQSTSLMLEDSSKQWRNYIQKEGMTIEDGRRYFLRSIIVESGDERRVTMEEIPTIARYLCMRVEQQLLSENFSA